LVCILLWKSIGIMPYAELYCHARSVNPLLLGSRAATENKQKIVKNIVFPGKELKKRLKKTLVGAKKLKVSNIHLEVTGMRTGKLSALKIKISLC